MLGYNVSMTKMVSLITEMYEKNAKEFADFQDVHDTFMRDRKANQEIFNTQGKAVVEIIRFYETQLCGKQERSGMGVYSSKLAEKYWAEIKKKHPMIDLVAVKFS